MFQKLINLFSNSKRNLWLAIIWTAIILFACFIPGNNLPPIDIIGIDKVVHILLFAAGSFIWYLAFKNHQNIRHLSLWIFLANLGLGILVEIIQSTPLVIGRGGDFWDAVADGIGAAIGLPPAIYIKKKLKEG